MTQRHNALLSAAVSSALALAATLSPPAEAAAPPLEKCFGIAKAGKNDCGSKSLGTTCQGTSTKDGQGDAYIEVLKGNCEKIVGGSLTPKTGK